MKKILFIFIVSLTFANETKRLNQLEKELVLEMAEIIRLEKKLDAPSFELSYRKLEVAFELFKKYQDEENRQFINRGEYDDRSRSEFFSRSLKQAEMIEEVGKKTLNRFKDKRDIYRVYFLLGQVANDLSQFEKAKNYIAKGLLVTPDDNEEAQDEKYTNMAMYAEIQFNKKKFNEASKFYEILIKKSDHFAINKFRYNYAYCLYNLGQFEKALTFIKLVANDSPNNKYDLRTEAISQSYIFFEAARKFEEGIEFYKKNKPEVLWDFSKHLLVKGFVAEGINSFNALLSSLDSNEIKKTDYKVKFLQIVLDNSNYKAFSSIMPMLKSSMKNEETIEQVRIFLKNSLADLQVKYKSKDGVRTSDLFMQMIELTRQIIVFLINNDPRLIGEHYFVLGDYFYDLELYQKAFEAYELSLKNKEYSNGEMKTGKLQVDSMTEIYSSKKIISGIEKRRRVYLERIRLNPLDEKNLPLLSEIYQIDMKLKNFSSAEDVLTSMKKIHNVSDKILMPKILTLFNTYIETRAEGKLVNLLTLTKSLKIILPSKSVTKIVDTIDQIKFDASLVALNKGQFKEAFKGFSYLIKQSKNSKIIMDSSYNLALTTYKMGNLENAFSIMLNWNQRYKKEDVSFFNKILKDLEQGLSFKKQYDLTEKLLNVTCSKRKDLNSIYLKILADYSTLDGGVEKALLIIKKYANCSRKRDVDNLLTLLVDLLGSKDIQLVNTHWSFFRAYPRSFYKIKEYVKSLYIYNWNTNIIKTLNILASKVASEDREFYTVFHSDKLGLPLVNSIKTIPYKKISFPPDVFKAQVSTTLSSLAQKDELVRRVAQLNSPFMYEKALGELINIYTKVIKDLISFRPPIEDASTKAGFERSVSELTQGLSSKKNELIAEYRTIRSKNEYDSLRNTKLYSIEVAPVVLYENKIREVR